MDFREFIKMKRALAGPDGKSRAKAGPSGNGKKADIQNRGRSFLRPTQPRVPHKTGNNDKKQPTPVKTSRLNRVAKGYEAAKSRFKNVTSQVKGAAETIKKQGAKLLPKSNSFSAAKHAVKQRVVDAGKKAAKVAKMVKQKVAAPVIKRGR